MSACIALTVPVGRGSEGNSPTAGGLPCPCSNVQAHGHNRSGKGKMGSWVSGVFKSFVMHPNQATANNSLREWNHIENGTLYHPAWISR